MKYLSRISSFLAGQRLLLLLCLTSLFALEGWGTATTGTINFGSGSGDLNINAASVSGDDDKGNNWSVETIGTTSYTPNANFAQVGSSSKPATSITFTMTLAASQTINEMSAKFGGYIGTVGTVTLKVGSDTIGTGSLNETIDVVVSNTKEATGTVLTVIVEKISKGVNCYYISYTYGATKYTVTWKNNGETYATTSVIDGKKPTFPATPTSCDLTTSSTFYGWTQTTWDGTTDDISGKTADATKIYTVASAMPNVGDAVTYHAVFAKKTIGSASYVTGGTFSDAVTTQDGWTGSGVGTYSGNGVKFDDVGDYILSPDISSNNYTNVTVKFKAGYIGGSGSVFKIASLDASGNEITSTTRTPSDDKYNSQSTIYTVDLEGSTVIKWVRITMTSKTDNMGMKYCEVFHSPITWSKYLTSCIACATNVTLDGGSPSNGTVTFANTTLPTCDEDKTVTMTINPADGYQLHTFSVATGDGKVATKSMSAEVDLDNNSSDAQEIDLTFAQDANGAYNVTATFTEKTVTGWTFTNHIGGATVTDEPIEIYVNQRIRVDIAYSPTPLVSSHTSIDSYNYPTPWSHDYLKSPNKAGAYFTIDGKASTNGETTSVTLTHNDGPTKTIYLKVLPLPTDHFLDLVHGVEFADQSATLITSEGVTNGGVSYTYTAPGSDQDEWSSSYANTCEQKKVKLVGWVESEYADACIAADSFPTTDALKADGTHFFAVGATMTASNKTYYAVWAEKE